ncbi:MAG: hypothetical protein A3J38_04360 [Gammaproteobacteria bacterium RIFCSPHIGHO2_12_FULL_45_9]|nr:MAG: hypothetical protein A3J38_04360 [Gammaproteobacteria bacterium RIFCSPHIGHO2_12_FULL_45_9]
MPIFKGCILYLCIHLLSSCSLAPDYQRPAMMTPKTYKETGTWVTANPRAVALGSVSWWTLYQDAMLTALEEKVARQNLDVRAALARYDGARADAVMARAAYFPNLVSAFNAYKQSDNTGSSTTNLQTAHLTRPIFWGFDLAYEIDVWGKIRNSVKAANDVAQASLADFAVVRLSLQAELAVDYFALRADDEMVHVLNQQVAAYERALHIAQHRYQGGSVSESALDDAESQLEAARTVAADIIAKRATLEHAIAVIVGEIPENFSIPVSHQATKQIMIQPNLPSTLLERRPDVAEAEWLVQAANAEIGIARAAFFPAFNLSGAIGFESSTLANLLKSSSFVWSAGPTAGGAFINPSVDPFISQPLFEGGRLRAMSAKARAHYEETASNYRQTVLTAYRQVEDQLVALRQLDVELHTQTAAVSAANRAWQQAMYRYEGGVTTDLDVVVAENQALRVKLNAIQVKTRRMVASVQLIKALGGGWSGVK